MKKIRWSDEECNVNVLRGKVVTDIQGCHEGSEEIVFTCDDGSVYLMSHHDD